MDLRLEAPFEVIFLNGRLGRDPEMLFPQLAEGGRLVAIMGRTQRPRLVCSQKLIREFRELQHSMQLRRCFRVSSRSKSSHFDAF